MSLSYLSLCMFYFLSLTTTQWGVISHSAQRGLEELKATEQKKNRKTQTGKGDRGVERFGGGVCACVTCLGGGKPDRARWRTGRWRD